MNLVSGFAGGQLLGLLHHTAKGLFHWSEVLWMPGGMMGGGKAL